MTAGAQTAAFPAARMDAQQISMVVCLVDASMAQAIALAPAVKTEIASAKTVVVTVKMECVKTETARTVAKTNGSMAAATSILAMVVAINLAY